MTVDAGEDVGKPCTRVDVVQCVDCDCALTSAVGATEGRQDGGTGAAPMALMDNVGLTIKELLPILADLLRRHGVRDLIKVFTSGKLISPAEVGWGRP